MKVAIWAKAPSPHQKDFYAALRQSGVNLCVRYLRNVSKARHAIGWSQPSQLPANEIVVGTSGDLIASCPDWRERIHVIPGYSTLCFIPLVLRLSREQVPWVHWSENSQPSWRSAISWIVKRSYAYLVRRHALGAFAIGESAARDFIRWGIRRESITHLYYSVNGVGSGSERDSITSAFVGDRMAVVFAGSLIPLKACDVLVKAFAQATAGSSAWVLVMVGGGSHQQVYQQLAVRLGIQDRVLFRGVLPREQIGSVLRLCHVLVLPSRYDGWGVVMNEAASTGLALIATDRVGSAHHLIESGWNGRIVTPGSVSALAAGLRSYVRSPDLARQHGQRSLLRFDEFVPQRNAQRFINSIQMWLAGNDQWRNRLADRDCVVDAKYPAAA